MLLWSYEEALFAGWTIFFLFYCNEYSIEKEAKINGESVSPQWENVE